MDGGMVDGGMVDGGMVEGGMVDTGAITPGCIEYTADVPAPGVGPRLAYLGKLSLFRL